MTSARRRALRTGALLLLAVLLVAFARRVDWHAAAGALRSADPRLLAAALVLNLASLAFKGVRWWIVLRPLGAVPLPLTLRATFAGASLNNLVVAQGGEGARVLLVARATGVASAGVLAALALDRALDVASYLLLLVASAWLLELPEHLLRWRFAATALLLSAALAVAVFGIAGRRTGFRVDGGDGMASRGRVATYLRTVYAAAMQLSTVPRLAVALALSLAAWALQVATYHLTALALHLPMPLAGSISALLAVGISFLVRATPGNVGVFQLIYAVTVRPFGIGEAAAVAAALLIQTIQVVPTVILGALVAPRLLRGTPRPVD